MDRHFLINLLIFVVCSSMCAADDVKPLDTSNYKYYKSADRSPCAFPFTYAGKSYSECTTDGPISPKLPWCSLTPDYIGVGTYCHDFKRASLVCLDTYTVNGKEYKGCDYIPKTAKYKQCMTNSTDLKLRYCVEDHVVFRKKPTVGDSKKCDPDYYKISKSHTMCFPPSDSAIQVPFTDTEQTQLLDLHNKYRAEPESKFMLKLSWDDELAKIAQAHSDLCFFDHDAAENRISKKYGFYHGQNMVRAFEITTTPVKLFQQMFDAEKTYFRYGDTCAGKDSNCLHYTQLMQAGMTRMGCGRTHCMYPHGFEHLVVCNYLHSQYDDTIKKPYELRDVGAKEGECGGTRDGNLCDCGKLACNVDSEIVIGKTCSCQAMKKKRSIFKRSAKHGRVPVVAIPKDFSETEAKPAKRDLSAVGQEGLAQ